MPHWLQPVGHLINQSNTIEMTNLVILTQNHWTKGGTIRSRVMAELAQHGYSHIFNDNDFSHYRRLHRNKLRRSYSGSSGNPSHVALEIARAWIDDNPQQKSDFDSLEFTHPESL